MPQFRSYPQANAIAPTDAFILDRVGAGSMYIEGLNLVVGAPYIVPLEFLGTPPLSSEIMGLHVFPVAVDFANGLSSIVLYSDTAPTADQVVEVFKVHLGTAVSLGTWTATAGSHYAVATSITAALSFAAGDAIRHTAPSATDATWSNITWTIAGEVAA